DSAPAELLALNNKVVTLAEAGLWKDALALLPDLEKANAQAANNTVAWNIILVRLNGEEKKESLQGTELVFPILQYLFFGDYEAAVAPFRSYTPEEIFSQESPLILDSDAAGWEESIHQWIFNLSDAALDVMEKDSDIAAAYFLRAWAAYLTDPADPAILDNLDQAVQFSPDDPLYRDSLAFLQAPNAELAPEEENSLITQEDGSTLFLDRDSGYQLTIPADWIVIPLGEGDYESLLQVGADTINVDQNLLDMLLSQADTTNALFMAWNFDSATLSDSGVPTITLIKQELPGKVPTEFVLKASAQSMPKLLAGAEVLSSDMVENAQGVNLGVIEILLPTSEESGGDTIYEKLALLVNNSTMFNLTTVVDQKFRDTIEPIFDEVIDSITLQP
ncbi:MAG: hypothetical protein GXP38_12220, partial [Chloroflexi bacterium]|nr:hypothetical protein [Chloroflexota bacterium]